jgi:hypothetical protein
MMQVMVTLDVVLLALAIMLLDLDRRMVDPELSAQLGGLLEHVLRVLRAHNMSTHGWFAHRKGPNVQIMHLTNTRYFLQLVLEVLVGHS